MLISVQLLRAFAALSVAFGHMPVEAIPRWLLFLRSANGVDLFFVISGYIIGLAAFGRPERPRGLRAARNFMLRRVIRIYPTYIVVSLAVLVVGALFFHLHPSASFFLRSLSLIPQADDQGVLVYPFVTAAWTLSFEMFFYLCVALLILLRRSEIWTVSALLGLLVAWGALGQTQNAVIATMTNSIHLEFLMGLWILALQRQIRPQTFQNIGYFMLAVGLPLFMFSRLADGALSEGVYQGMNVEIFTLVCRRWILWGIPSALLFFGVLSLEPWIRKIKWARAISILGDASYSLYLIHYPLLVFVGQLISAKSFWYFPVATGALVATSILFFKWIERPTIDYLKQKSIS